MVPRLWVCLEQPLYLSVLAAPVHPLVLLGLASLFGIARLADWARFEMLTRRALVVVGSVWLGLLAFFVVLGGAISLVGFNPDGLLILAPWAWAVAGPVAAVMAVRQVRRSLGRTGLPAVETEEPGGLWILATMFAVCSFVFVAARYVVSDRNLLSLPYRALEWVVIDELGPVSDECLASRVLEYGNEDQIGKDAMKALLRRDLSAVPGVVDRLVMLRRDWPPPDYSATSAGIIFLLGFVEKRGEHRLAQEWRESDWEREFLKVKTRLPWIHP